MSYPSETVLGFLGGSGFFWLLIGGLLLSLLLGVYESRRGRPAGPRDIWLGATTMLACFLAWAACAWLFRLGRLAPELWMAPFDRLFIVAWLVGLGWALTPAWRDRSLWRRFLAAGLLLTVLAYAFWAPLWARAVHLQPALAADPTGLARAWDAWQVILSAAVAVAVARRAERAPAWLVTALGGLVVANLLEFVVPLSPVFPAWSRLGTLVAGSCFALAAVAQAGRLRLEPRRSESLPPDALDFEVDTDVVVDQALRAVASRLGAAPVFVCLVAGAADVDVRVLAGPGGDPRRLGSLPLIDLPTLARALNEGRLSLGAARLAPDVVRLFALARLPVGGAVLLQRVGEERGRGIVVAGRSRGRWEARDQATLASVARWAGAALEAVAAQTAGRDDLSRALGAIEAQATAVNRLIRTVDGLVRRVDALETATQASAPLAGGDATSPFRPPRHAAPLVELAPAASALQPFARAGSGMPRALPAPGGDPAAARAARLAVVGAAASDEVSDARDDLGGRVPRYERALERLPWGVVVADAADRVVFANPAAARLLHLDDLAPGTPLGAAFPDPDRIDLALHRARKQAAPAGAARERAVTDVTFDSPAVRVELATLSDGASGYLGAVATLSPADAAPSDVDHDLVRGLGEALGAPMTMILGYSDLLRRGAGLTDEQLERFLQRIDANLARMQVGLANLVTVLELKGAAAAAPEAVDVEHAIHQAVDRARAHLAEKTLAVNLDVAGPLPHASADPAAVGQIIDNLLVNAALRSPQGGDITVGAEVREGSGARAVVISVHDRGSQLGGGSSVMEIDANSAVPVALTVVRLLTSRQGGRAWAESDPLGARFYVRLPLRKVA